MDKLKIGILGGIVGVIASISGAFWVWALTELIRLGDYFMLQVVTFFIPEPPHLPPVDKSPLVIFYPFYDLYLAMNRIVMIGEIHYILVAATLVLVGIGIYGFYKLEPLRIFKVPLILGFLCAFFILLIMFSSLTSLIGYAVNIGLLMVYSAQTGFPFGSNIGFLMSTPTVFSSMIYLVILFIFGLSIISAKWVTYDPDKAQNIAILLIIGGLLFIIGVITPLLYIIPYLILSVAFSLVAYLFYMTQYYS